MENNKMDNITMENNKMDNITMDNITMENNKLIIYLLFYT